MALVGLLVPVAPLPVAQDAVAAAADDLHAVECHGNDWSVVPSQRLQDVSGGNVDDLEIMVNAACDYFRSVELKVRDKALVGLALLNYVASLQPPYNDLSFAVSTDDLQFTVLDHRDSAPVALEPPNALDGLVLRVLVGVEVSPDSHFAVRASTQDPSGAALDTGDASAVPVDQLEHLSCVLVPYYDLGVRRSRDHLERVHVNAGHCGLVTLGHEVSLLRLYVPAHDGRVHTSSVDFGVVEEHASDDRSVAQRLAHVPALLVAAEN
mmetsp:Transcript_13479/g.24786  ORF Transcript_13479/g.24786 Transcript_13479/m.24786 type:complete len:266 (-) Transcript_13479:446-1243(-)